MLLLMLCFSWLFMLWLFMLGMLKAFSSGPFWDSLLTNQIKHYAAAAAITGTLLVRDFSTADPPEGHLAAWAKTDAVAGGAGATTAGGTTSGTTGLATAGGTSGTQTVAGSVGTSTGSLTGDSVAAVAHGGSKEATQVPPGVGALTSKFWRMQLPQDD